MQPDPFASLHSVTAPLRPIHDAYWVIPGRLLAGEYPAVTFNPEATNRRLSAFLESGFVTFINLVGLGEAEEYAPILAEMAAVRGVKVECLNFPIGDYGLPSVMDMHAILNAIDKALIGKHKVYLHCYGGIGRTGTVVGCYLVQHGQTGQQALTQLAAWWRNVPKSMRFPNSPETVDQENFILGWHQPKE